MSFAIIETGGKQYKVSPSKIIKIEKLNAEKGKTIQFKNVLLLNDNKDTKIGNPNVTGAVVEAKLLDNEKDRTILVFHKRRRKNSRKKNGHRQIHSKVQITKILSSGGKIVTKSKVDSKLAKSSQKIGKSKSEVKKTKVKKVVKK